MSKIIPGVISSIDRRGYDLGEDLPAHDIKLTVPFDYGLDWIDTDAEFFRVRGGKRTLDDNTFKGEVTKVEAGILTLSVDFVAVTQRGTWQIMLRKSNDKDDIIYLLLTQDDPGGSHLEIV